MTNGQIRASLFVGGVAFVALLAGCGDDSSTTGNNAGAAGTAGTAGTGGSSAGTAGSSGASAQAGTGGSSGESGASGSSGTGGSGATGGSAGQSGSSGTGGSAGSGATGGNSGSSGSAGTGAIAGSGGSSGTGGSTGCTDGQTESCYDGPVGTEGVGICIGGVKTCTAGQFGQCEGQILPDIEQCNSLDDDCDGESDNGDPGGGSSCTADAQLGECAKGTLHCTDGSVQCIAAMPSIEVCDGFDNNCDGSTDENNPDGGGACDTGLLGVCATGVLTCTNAALQCVASSSPSLENCVTSADEDCDGDSSLCTGTTSFAKGVAAISNQQGKALAVDQQGNVLVIGNFTGFLDLGGGALGSSGGQDIFVAKYDSQGNHLWSKRFGDFQDQTGTGVAVDPQGNVYLTGHFLGAVDFGTGPLNSSGSTDIFVAKLDSTGAVLWANRYGNNFTQEANGISVDPFGNVAVVGSFSGSMNIGGSMVTSAGNLDVLLFSLDTNGNPLWAHGYGGVGTQQGLAVTSDSFGNVAITGTAEQAVDFGGGQLIVAGQEDIFVAKFDFFGQHLWSKIAGDNNVTLGQRGRAIAADSLGNIIVAGEFNGSVDFGGGLLVSAGNVDGFLVKFDPLGSALWSKRFGDATPQRGKGVAVDVFDNVILTGEFTGTIDLGAGPINGTGQHDVLVSKFDPAGTLVWAKSFGSSTGQNDRGEAVATGSDATIWTTGTYAGPIDFGTGVLPFVGGDEMFLIKLAPLFCAIERL